MNYLLANIIAFDRFQHFHFHFFPMAEWQSPDWESQIINKNCVVQIYVCNVHINIWKGRYEARLLDYIQYFHIIISNRVLGWCIQLLACFIVLLCMHSIKS